MCTNTVENNTSSLLLTQQLQPSAVSRWLQVAPLAILVTLCLLIFMERLIAMADVVIDESPDLVPANIYWEEHIIETRPEEIVKKPEPIDATPERPVEMAEVDTHIDISIPRSGVEYQGEETMIGNVGYNMPVPQFLGAAKYPPIAIRRGIEGYVDVRFDVTEYGGTDNITVLNAVPAGIFDKAAVKAVARWRYQPKTEDEKPVRFEGMLQRVRFEMQK